MALKTGPKKDYITIGESGLKPAPLLVHHGGLLRGTFGLGPVLDLACGAGHNGLYLASLGASAVLVDRDEARLASARDLAGRIGVSVEFRWIDLEGRDTPPLASKAYGTILVFRYLHRPLVPFIKDALMPGGVVVYETFTSDQRKYGKPRSPDFLLEPGELRSWFEGWEILHDFEGELDHPKRAMAQIVCRKHES